MPTLTVYPNANPETVSVDGFAYQYLASGMTWAVARAGAGTGATDTSTYSYIMRLQAYSTASRYTYLYRSIFLFDTSALPDIVEITDATFSVRGQAKTDTNAKAPNLNVYSSAPASNTAVVAGDYDSLGETPFCDTPITYAGFSTAAYNNFLLNAAGIAAIISTGVTKLGLRNANYDVANIDPALAANTNFSMSAYYADYTGTTYDPKLVINYALGDNWTQNLSDSISTADSNSNKPTLAKSDTISAADANHQSPNLGKFDNVVVSDNAVKAVRINKADIVATADAIIAKAFGIAKADSVIVSDEIGFTHQYSLNLLDDIQTSDNMNFQLTSPGVNHFFIYNSEHVILTDNLSKAITAPKTDSIVITDQASMERGLFKALNDSVGVADEIQAIRGIFKILSDAISVVDNRIKANGLIKVDAIRAIDFATIVLTGVEGENHFILSLNDDIITADEVSQEISQGDTDPPEWVSDIGIISLTDNADGSMRAIWGRATDPSTPVLYKLYIKKSTPAGLFSEENLLCYIKTDLELDIFTEADGITDLDPDKTYYVGVKALDGEFNETTNENYASAVPTTPVQAIGTSGKGMIYNKASNKKVFFSRQLKKIYQSKKIVRLKGEKQ